MTKTELDKVFNYLEKEIFLHSLIFRKSSEWGWTLHLTGGYAQYTLRFRDRYTLEVHKHSLGELINSPFGHWVIGITEHAVAKVFEGKVYDHSGTIEHIRPLPDTYAEYVDQKIEGKILPFFAAWRMYRSCPKEYMKALNEVK